MGIYYYEQALIIQKSIFGEISNNVLTSLLIIANLYLHLRDYKKANEFYK